MKYNTSELDRIIRDRRSVFPRDYQAARVDNQIIRQMLANANWAPTHKLTEPWRFVVFTGRGLHKLAEFQGACYKMVAERNGTFNEEKYKGLLSKPLESSHVIAVCMKRDLKRSVPEIEEVGAVFCAIQNMYLTATAYEVGCYLSTGGITNLEEAKEFFGLEKDDRLLGFMHVGLPKGQVPAGRRRPIEEKVQWVE